MNYRPPLLRHLFGFRLILTVAALACSAWPALSLAAPAPAGAGTLSGTVSNAATGDLLEGVRVSVPTLDRTVLTDHTGRFLLADVPAGTHAIVVTYTGLDSAREDVTILAGQTATRDFSLSSAVYRLEAFTVAGEREGGAAAITAQRNAPNTKNVVAMDSYGNLPNMSASELAILLPGVTGALNLENGVDGFAVRGMPSGQNSVTMDGGMISTQGAFGRTVRINNLTGAMFEGLEVIKGHTPDKGADSLGGTINLKSRSPLSMREKRRMTYNFTLRWAPPFFETIPLREPHRTHPLLNVGYWEVFDVAGGSRNLGVAINTFYSENVAGSHSTTREYESTFNPTAFLYDYNTFDQYNNRKQASVNLKLEYRLSPTTKLTLNSVYNDANEMGKLRFTTRAFTNQVVGTTGTAGILPGYTDKITQVRPSTASNFDVGTIGPNNFFLRMRHLDLGAEHQWSRLQLDYSAMMARTYIENGNGNEGGQLTMRVNGAGWILDRTHSEMYPQFTQTAGPDISRPENYRVNGFFRNNNQDNDHDVREARANLKCPLPALNSSLKAGLFWREQTVEDTVRDKRWSYLGTTLPSDPTITILNSRKTGRVVPFWYASQLFRDRTPIEPSLWREDLYWGRQVALTNSQGVTEEVQAGYIMAQGRAAGTGFLTGVRFERTETNSWGNVRSRVLSTAAQQAADPIGMANRDYGNWRELHGSYTKSFPSVHLTRDFGANWKGRLSWSTSFGRPSLNSLVPNETVNETQRTLTVNNPSLLPQTASNWDAAIEYYFEPAGSLSVGWFRKVIKDFIIAGLDNGIIASGPDNGYSGEYAGYTRLSSGNAGTAYVQGWEISYQQQFTFLPGFLKGLGASANFTALEAHGDFGSGTQLGTREVEGFVPRSANASLYWRHRGFTSRVIISHTGSFLNARSAVSPALHRYWFDRTVVHAGIGYQLRPAVTFSLDVNNLTDAPQSAYRGVKEHLQFKLYGGTTVTAGISGRF
ncbi:MAG: TonB-dependent receptor [Verrucomicrobia bacterium]|nr:TonB-dependent receptor [Verrucomicrobiota bacterium]